MATYAIIIIGAVCSGKTALAAQLAKKTNFKLVNEQNTGNFFKIISQIDSSKYTRAIFEHCYLYNQTALVAKQYNKVLLIQLNTADNILISNKNKRVNSNEQGDVKKIDPIKQKAIIQNEFSEWLELVNTLKNVTVTTINIANLHDYDIAEKEILNIVTKMQNE